jgi:hypothetical protein
VDRGSRGDAASAAKRGGFCGEAKSKRSKKLRDGRPVYSEKCSQKQKSLVRSQLTANKAEGVNSKILNSSNVTPNGNLSKSKK